jgi:hypothetical protein
MLDLEERLRRLATEHERAARVPAASAAIRRGHRRRRRLAGVATVTVLSLLACLVGVRELRQPAALEPPAGPAAPATTAACKRPPCNRAKPMTRGYEPVKGTVVGKGEQPGFRWRLVIHRGKLPDGQYQLVALFERDDHSPPVDLVTLEPVSLSMSLPTRRFPIMHGIVTDRTDLVRLRITRGGAPLAPVEVRPTDGGAIFPHNSWFVAFLPKGSELNQIELLDRRGQAICSERLRTVKLPGGSETIPGGSCF